MDVSPVDSTVFGVGPDGHLLDAASLYTVPRESRPQERLCFDVSNNRISCSINAWGLLERLVIELGVSPVETRATPVGAYMEKVLQRFGPFPFFVKVEGASPQRLDQLGQPEIYLQDTLFPRYEWTLPAVKIRMLVFAPETSAARLRAICTLWSIEPRSSVAPVLTLKVGDDVLSLHEEDTGGKSLLIHSDGGGWFDSTHGGGQEFAMTQGRQIAVAVLLGSSSDDLAQTRKEFTGHRATEWFDLTRTYHQARYGSLKIPDSPYFAELYVRAAELCRQSLMVDTRGDFGGSFNGSDLPAAANIWMRDCFYGTLPQSFLSPGLCASAIHFFLQWGIPSRPLGEHADKFQNAAGITNSLGNSVAGIVLAGAYYASTDDKQFLQTNPYILSRSTEILEQVLASRREDVFLFPSIYVSDGESRGDYHTGSNIFVWRAFTSLARLVREVYGRSESADRWQQCAGRLRAAILENCVVTEDGKTRFVEGAMQDHTQISGHDGEESDVTLASFYEFCGPDDPRYLGAAAEALSTANPYLFRELEGIWWYAHGKWSSSTFPGWITALASSRDDKEMLHHLQRIRSLTDADGSFWWWPYPHDGATHLASPLRVSSKCGWAAGAYLCFFTSQVLGLGFDAPTNTLTFVPFSPWSFEWMGCRLGEGLFDCSYSKTKEEILLTVRNRMQHPVTLIFEAILPSGTTRSKEKDPASGSIQEGQRYGRIALRRTVRLAEQGQAELRVRPLLDQH